MSGFSVTTDNAVLNALFRNELLTTSAKYIGLFSSSAGLSENNSALWTEVAAQDGSGAATAYARKVVNDGDFAVANTSQTDNSVAFEFPVATADWGVVSHVAILDAATGGNVIAWGTFRNPVTLAPQPRNVYTGDMLTIRVGAFVIRLQDNPNI